MPETAKTVLQLLEQIRKERDELNVLILGLERRLGIAPAGDHNESQTVSPRITVSVDSIPLGFFHNLSQGDAAEKLLKLNPSQPLKTTEIMDAFRKSGMTFTSKNALTILYTTLKRSPRFTRLAGKAWGLSEWYADSKRKRKEQDSESSSDSESYG
jgi:hypothetical protein